MRFVNHSVAGWKKLNFLLSSRSGLFISLGITDDGQFLSCGKLYKNLVYAVQNYSSKSIPQCDSWTAHGAAYRRTNNVKNFSNGRNGKRTRTRPRIPPKVHNPLHTPAAAVHPTITAGAALPRRTSWYLLVQSSGIIWRSVEITAL